MIAGLANGECRKDEARQRHDEPQHERRGSEAGPIGDDARQERGYRHRRVAGRLVQPKGEPAAAGPHEVDLHHHRHGPRQPLVDPEEDIRDDDPFPTRRPDEDEWYRHTDQPARNEDRAATEGVREQSSGEVRQCLGDPEGDEEGQCRRDSAEPEDLRRHEWHDRALLADHRADEYLDADEQRELAGIRAKAECD